MAEPSAKRALIACATAGSMQAAAGAMIVEGMITQEEVDVYTRLYLDPAYNYPGFTLFCAWGRKPV